MHATFKELAVVEVSAEELAAMPTRGLLDRAMSAMAL